MKIRKFVARFYSLLAVALLMVMMSLFTIRSSQASTKAQNLLNPGPYPVLSNEQVTYTVSELGVEVERPLILDFAIDSTQDRPLLNRPLVLLMHGNGYRHEKAQYKAFRDKFASYGYHVVKPDWKSEAFDTVTGLRSIHRALDKAFELHEEYYSGKVILAGHSRGGERIIAQIADIEGYTANNTVVDVISILALNAAAQAEELFVEDNNANQYVDNIYFLYSRFDNDVSGEVGRVFEIEGVPHKGSPFKYYDDHGSEFENNDNMRKLFNYGTAGHGAIADLNTTLPALPMLFVKAFVEKDAELANFIRQGEKLISPSHSQLFDQSDKKVVSNFEQRSSYYYFFGGDQSNQEPIGRVYYDNMLSPPFRKKAHEFDEFFVHDTHLLELNWRNTYFPPFSKRGSITFDYYDSRRINVSDYGFLNFNIGQIRKPDNLSSISEMPAKVTLRSVHELGNGIQIKRTQTVPFVIEDNPHTLLGSGEVVEASKNFMMTTSIPLTKFNQVDLFAIDSITLEFDRSGSAILDQIQFIKGKALPSDPINIVREAPDNWSSFAIDEQQMHYFSLHVPANRHFLYSGVQNTNALVNTENYDLYFALGRLPTEQDFDYRFAYGFDEHSAISVPESGLWYILVKNRSGNSGHYNFYARSE